MFNTTPYTATGYTPFELIYGHLAALHTTLITPLKLTYTYDNYVAELREKLRAAHQIAKANLQKKKQSARILR